MNKYQLTLLVLFISLISFNQLIAQSNSQPKPLLLDINGNELPGGTVINLGCGNNASAIEASYPNIGDTSEYIVEKMDSYSPKPFLRDNEGNGYADNINHGALLSTLGDDYWSDEYELSSNGLDLNFCFFGNQRKYFRIAENGAVTFNTTGNYPTPPGYGQYSGHEPRGWLIHTMGKIAPDANMDLYRESILTPFHDIFFLSPDTFSDTYSFWDIAESNTAETNHERYFIQGFHAMPMYSCQGSNNYATHQMVFYETTNIIEFHIKDKPICDTWAQGFAALGIQNKDLDLGYSAPGRDNLEHWQVLNLNDQSPHPSYFTNPEPFDANYPVEPSESWRFIPSGGTVRPDFTWYKNYDFVTGTGTLIDASDIDPSTTLDPNNPVQLFAPTVDTMYTAVVIYTDYCGTNPEVKVTQSVQFVIDNNVAMEIVNANAPNDPIADSINLCEGETLDVLSQVESDIAGSTFTYEWSLTTNGSTNVVGSTDAYTIDSADITSTGLYEVFVQVFDAAGMLICSIADDVTVTVSNPSFIYPNTTYCSSTTATATPVNVTPVDGIFSISNGGVIDSTTGVVDIVTSDLGTDGTGNFTITYTIGTAPNDCDATFDINISSGEPEIDYAAVFCITAANPIPTSFSPTGGVFTITNGATFIDNTTGEVDITSLTSGSNYTVTYTTTGVCGGSTDDTFTVSNAADATFSYADPICLSTASSLLPDAITTGGGNFTINTGVIDVLTGDLAGNTAGNYDVTYTTVGCVDSSTITVTINAVEDASFNLDSTACAGDGNITPTFNATTTTGGTFTINNSGVINSVTGEITVDSTITSNSTYDVTYTTNGNCPESTTESITINAEDDPSFTYTNPTYCIADTDPLPNSVTLPGGIFTIGNGGVIDAATGEIDLTASGAGNFVITYTTDATNLCPNSTTFDLTITAQDLTDFGYDRDGDLTETSEDFCLSDMSALPNPSPTTTGGTYTINNGGVFLDTGINTSLTGEIDITTSSLGTDATGNFTITYATSGACTNTSTFDVTINADEQADFNYGLTFCSDDTDPLPTITGTTGGTFSITNDGVINVTTGAVDLSASGLGTDLTGVFTITYTTQGICSDADTFNITVELTNDATFDFPDDVCFADTTNPSATNFVVGGTFSVLPNTATVSASGVLDLTTTTAGTSYDITYSFGGNCMSSTTNTVNIVANDDSSFTYLGSPYCNDDTNPLPNSTTTGGGTFSINNGGIFVDSGTSTNSSTGEIDLSASGLGTDATGNFMITYATVGACSTSTNLNITIELTNDASFEFPSNVCIADANPFATNITTNGGTFSVLPNTATISANGVLDLSTTSEGTIYTIRYEFDGNCPSDDSHTILINNSPMADTPSALSSCNNGDGTANFNILSIENEFNTTDTITYHPTENDANSATNVMSTSPFLVATGNVWARVENANGCFITREVMLVVDQCLLVFPEVFSPNSSDDYSENREFTIRDTNEQHIDDAYPNFEIWIYNRYGNEVYHGKKDDADWNGKVDNDGKELPTGTYFFGIKLNNKTKITQRGWVYLQR